ncbi:WD40 repeat-like protein [Sporormia fimetaria CBS 119925]|uniref:WD40 repeat-like protein n=1 Tax=Sporormia fimetaria CBS 119925 TaxID=1340428 RepID=A0A6A6VBS0_9PLEO|nr:WD40 repeat-like protein [Sporormia fimetaria CBS 119925]
MNESTSIPEQDQSTVDAHKQEIIKTEGAVKAKPKKSKKKAGSRWSWSPSIGGWFLSQDPVFTSDEKYLLLSSPKALHVYATDTSTLLRTLSKPSSFISAYAVSATNPNHVYTANETGLITLWDWTEGKTVGRWDIGSNVRNISVVRDPATDLDLVYSHESSSSHFVHVHALRTREQGAPTELKPIFKRKAPISGMQVLLDGKIVVIAIQKSVLIGKRTKLGKTALQDYEYVWREFQTAKRVTTFDAHVRTADAEGKTSGEGDHIDLAVGDQDGVISLFEDILSSLNRIEKGRKDASKADTADAELLRPKRLHWHRQAVASVKWSRDGNYLISGGAETVLVLWQLSTGKQQHLPHLTAAIENIVVSPSGASYSVTLANNSVVVLSTTELEAKMNIIGVQSRRVDMEQFPRGSEPSKYPSDIFAPVPMVVNPAKPSQVLFTVPSSQPRHENAGRRPEPYLQTFDVATQHNVSRQALTRNNATDPNMSPEGKRIDEPNVTFIQLSSDGKWLATVDEWTPPRSYMAFLDEGTPEFHEQERDFRREIYLKFWQWDEKSSQWVLESRIDNPHLLEDVGANARILDVVADPSGTGFATIGEDRSLRIWRPKTRTRAGVTVRGADKKGEGLVTWSLHRSLQLPQSLDALHTEQSEPEQSEHTSLLSHRRPQHNHVAFSSDGSLIAAAVSDTETGVIHILDAATATIRRSITELSLARVSALGILHTNLLIITDSLLIWDLVADELIRCIPLSISPSLSPVIHLSINPSSNSFALAQPHFELNATSTVKEAQRYMKPATSVSVYNLTEEKAVWETTVSSFILALVCEKQGRGFVGLDQNCCIRVLEPEVSSAAALPAAGAEEVPVEAAAGVEKMEVEEELEESEEENETAVPGLESLLSGESLLLHAENDKPVVRPEQLQEVFYAGGGLGMLPPVRELFDRVVGLYARKPRTVVA